MPSEAERTIGRISELVLEIPRHIERGAHLTAAEKLSDLARLYRDNEQHTEAADTFGESDRQWQKAADGIGDRTQAEQFREVARQMRVEKAATLEIIAKGEANNRDRNFGAGKYAVAATTYAEAREHKEAARVQKLSAKAWSKAGRHSIAASKRVQAAEEHERAGQKWRARGSRIRARMTSLRPQRRRRR